MSYKGLLFAIFAFISLSSTAQNSKNLVEIKGASQLESEVLQSGKPAIIKVSATWCGPCKQSKKPYEALATDPANADVIFAEVDADASPDIVQKYNVQGLPTFIFIKNGQETKRTSGFTDSFKTQMSTEIATLRGGAATTPVQPTAEKKSEQPEAAEQMQAPEQPEVKAPATAEKPSTCAANPPENFLEKAFNSVRDFFTSIIDTISGWFK